MLSLARVALVASLSLGLGGCFEGTKSIGSVERGECRLVSTPEYAVRGARPYDQRWINNTTESLVQGCRQARPKERPESLDAPRATPAAIAVPLPKRRPLWRRTLGL